MTRPKHAGGRPTLYRREMCDRLVEAMAKGLTAEAAAARIGISARSLFYWQKQHPEFLQAIQEGRQRSQLWWEERAFAMVNGEAGNTQIVMLGLRNRSRAASGWNNDTVKLEHTGPEGGPLQRGMILIVAGVGQSLEGYRLSGLWGDMGKWLSVWGRRASSR